MIVMDRQRDGRWTVQFASGVIQEQRIVHTAIALPEALRVVRGKIEFDMMGLEAQLEISGEWPAISTLPGIMKAALDEMGEAVHAIDVGLDEEIKQRRELRRVYPIARNQTWVSRP